MELLANVVTTITKRVLIPLGLTAAISVAYPGIQRKIHGRNQRNCQNSKRSFGLLINGFIGGTQNEAKEQKGGFYSMLFGTL